MHTRFDNRVLIWGAQVALAILVVFSANQALALNSCSSGSASILQTGNGIEFRLDKSYDCWQNIDGTYTVVDDGNGVQVKSMSPSYSGGKHGYQIVERIQAGTSSDPTVQSLDDRQCQRLPSTRCSFVQPPSLPVTVPAERSLLKLVSNTGDSLCSSPGHERCVATATTLTVVGNDQTPGCSVRFRPPATGTKKPQYCADQLKSDIASKLPNLGLVQGQGPWSLSYANAQILKVPGTIFGVPDANHDMVANTFIPLDALIEHKSDRPINPQVGYGAPVANALTSVIMRTLQAGTVDQKYPVVWKSIQTGLDIWGLMDAGRSYYAAGGIQHGRVLPVLYAWYFLKDNQLLNKMGSRHFQENGFSYFSTITGEPLFGRSYSCISSETGLKNKKDNRWCAGNPNDIRDGGHKKFGSCGTDTSMKQPTRAEQLARGCWSMTSYQGMIAAYYGELAVARNLPGMEKAWNHPAFFGLYDKMLRPPWNGASPNYGSIFLVDFAMAYSNGDGSSVPVPEPEPSNFPSPYLR